MEDVEKGSEMLFLYDTGMLVTNSHLLWLLVHNLHEDGAINHQA